MNSVVYAVRNKSSKVLFVLLENMVDGKMRIINPEGKILIVPDGLFEPGFLVSWDEMAATFTSAQISSLKDGKQKKAPATKRVPKGIPMKPGVEEIAATWKSSRLTFFKHKIEPLRDSLSFSIEIAGKGTFVISKAEFKKVFNDVVISVQYWKEGDFSYGEFPDKALPFLR